LLRLEVHEFVLEIQVQGQDFEQLELAHDHGQVLDQRQGHGSAHHALDLAVKDLDFGVYSSSTSSG
jgi:hypothetical protein